MHALELIEALEPLLEDVLRCARRLEDLEGHRRVVVQRVRDLLDQNSEQPRRFGRRLAQPTQYEVDEQRDVLVDAPLAVGQAALDQLECF